MKILIRQLFSFGLVGLLNTVLSVGLILGLISVGFSFEVSNVLGYCFGMLFSFTVNRRLTFRSHCNSRFEVPRFLFVYGLAYGVQLLFAVNLQRSEAISPASSTIMGALLFAVMAFCGSRWLVFRV